MNCWFVEEADTPRQAKEQLRLQMRRQRKAISGPERVRKARRIAAFVTALPEVSRGSRVLAFASFGSEVPTEALLQALAGAGSSLLLPYLHKGEMEVCSYRPAIRSSRATMALPSQHRRKPPTLRGSMW